jgi:hypothetical protein
MKNPLETHYCRYELCYDDNGDVVECGKVAHFAWPEAELIALGFPARWYCADHIDYAGHPERNPEDPDYDPDWREHEEEEE